jgi:hypothetical protein
VSTGRKTQIQQAKRHDFRPQPRTLGRLVRAGRAGERRVTLRCQLRLRLSCGHAVRQPAEHLDAHPLSQAADRR